MGKKARKADCRRRFRRGRIIIGYVVRAVWGPWLEYKNVLALRVVLAGLKIIGNSFCFGVGLLGIAIEV